MKRFILFGCNSGQPSLGFEDFKGDFDTIDAAKAAIPSEFPGKMEGWDRQQIVDGLMRVSITRFHDGDEYSPWETNPLPGEKPILWTHTKRGGIYIADRKGKLELDGHDYLVEITGYTNVISNEFWTRKTTEFEDGRFEAVDLHDAAAVARLLVTETARQLVSQMIGSLMDDPRAGAMMATECGGGPISAPKAIHDPVSSTKPPQSEVDHRVDFHYHRIGHD